MSTNKTPNYQLHSWTPDDEFHVSEINENFEKLDTSALRMMFGTYTGTTESSDTSTTTLRIELPVTPKAVILFHGSGVSPNFGHAGIMAPGHPISKKLMPIDDTGFTVASQSSGLKFNEKNYTYHYIVLY